MTDDPLALLRQLSKALDARAKAVEEADNWYEGNHPIPDPPPNTSAAVDSESRRAFTAMSKLAITNFLPPVVDVPASKLKVEGFRFSVSPTSTDAEAWSIWTRNHLDGDFGLSTAGAIRTGQAPVLVWHDEHGKAEITVEDPAQVIIAYEPGSRRRRRAALKRWVDGTGRTFATLYTPTAIYKYQTASSAGSTLVLPASATGWTPREVPDEAWPVDNPYGVVTMLEVRANAPLKASLFGGGRPEFAKQINEQRRINQTVLDMLVTMEYQAFRQRWVTGWDYPMKPDGTPDRAQMAKASASRFMTFKPAEVGTEPVKVGEFSQADFRPFIDAVMLWVKVLASTSGTPPYAFLLGDMINVAADALARIEGVLTSKVGSLASAAGADAAEIIRLALLVEGNPKAVDPTITTVWGEFEERTATEQAGLAKTAKEMGAPDEAAFAMLPGVDQVEARRWTDQKRADALVADALAVPAPAQ